MKVLYLNAMCATADIPTGGIFIKRRMEAARQIGVEIVPVNIYVEDVGLLKWLKKRIFHMPLQSIPLKQQLSIKYTNVGVPYTVFDAICWMLDGKVGQKVVTRKFRKSILNEVECDIIHAHWFWPYAGEIAYWISQIKEIPYYITCHGSEINYAMKNPKYNSRMIFLLENAKRVEFVSRRLLDTAIGLGYTGVNARIISNGYDANTFKIIENKRSGHKIIGYVGNLLPVKGSDRLIKIIPQILDKIPDAEFIIIGDGVLRTRIEQKLSGFPVQFLGRLEPKLVSRYMNMMDVLLVPSRNEGFPCVVKEAQACGTVVVGSDVGGIKDAIGNGGIAVPYIQNEDEFVRKFSDLTIRILKNEIAIDIKQMLTDVKKYSWYELQKKTLEMYKET